VRQQVRDWRNSFEATAVGAIEFDGRKLPFPQAIALGKPCRRRIRDPFREQRAQTVEPIFADRILPRSAPGCQLESMSGNCNDPMTFGNSMVDRMGHLGKRNDADIQVPKTSIAQPDLQSRYFSKSWFVPLAAPLLMRQGWTRI